MLAMTPEEHESFLREAFDAYLSVRSQPGCIPCRPYLPYGAVDLKGLRWPTMGDMLIEDELRELTNNLNAWLGALRRWHAWQIVMGDYSEDERWELEHEFVTPLATYCLFQPSALRDAITFVVTNGMHQVLRSVDRSYPDRLPLDQAPWEKPSYPTRRRKEAQFAHIVARWPEGMLLLTALRKLDDQSNRHATLDFRNRASHSIAPRFSRGITRAVTRTVVQRTRLEPREDGYVNDVPVPGEVSIGYSFGGTDPLDLNQVREVNVQQFEVAVACFDHYVTLLKTTTG